MTHRGKKRTRQKTVLIIVLLAIILVGGGLYMIMQRNDSSAPENTQQSASNGGSNGSVIGTGEKAATLFEPIYSLAAYQKLLEEQSRRNNEVIKIAKLDTNDVNWSSQKVVPVKFFASAGQSISAVTVDNDGFVTVALLEAPSGCVYPAAQFKLMGFAVTSADQEIKSKDTIKTNMIKNEARCNS